MKTFQMKLSCDTGIYVFLYWLLKDSAFIMLNMFMDSPHWMVCFMSQRLRQENEVDKVSEGLDSTHQYDFGGVELSYFSPYSIHQSLETDNESDRIHCATVAPLLYALFDLLQSETTGPEVQDVAYMDTAVPMRTVCPADLDTDSHVRQSLASGYRSWNDMHDLSNSYGSCRCHQ